jgi:hypothetical protein
MFTKLVACPASPVLARPSEVAAVPAPARELRTFPPSPRISATFPVCMRRSNVMADRSDDRRIVRFWLDPSANAGTRATVESEPIDARRWISQSYQAARGNPPGLPLEPRRIC